MDEGKEKADDDVHSDKKELDSIQEEVDEPPPPPVVAIKKFHGRSYAYNPVVAKAVQTVIVPEPRYASVVRDGNLDAANSRF